MHQQLKGVGAHPQVAPAAASRLGKGVDVQVLCQGHRLQLLELLRADTALTATHLDQSAPEGGMGLHERSSRVSGGQP